MISLPPINKSVHDAIYLIERTFMQSSEDEAKSEAPEPVKDWPFKYESAKAIFQEQARMVRLTAVERKIPLVWLTRTHAALDTLTNFLCHFAKVNPQQIAEGYMLESDFPLLCNACGVVSGSKLRMCEADSTEQFEEIILALAKENEFSYVLCDWDLSKNELSFAEGLVQKGNVTVCWPQ